MGLLSGIVGLPPWPSVTAAPPSDAAAANPALAPMNSRRLSFLLILTPPSPCPVGRLHAIAAPATSLPQCAGVQMS